MVDMVDLHTHSTVSDGTLTPTELIIHAKEKGIKAIALTDHDTVAGLKEGAEVSLENDIEFINGIEFSSHCRNTEVHILGLYIDGSSEYLRRELIFLKETRMSRNIEMIRRLNEANVNITLDDVEGSGFEGITTRMNFANAIVSRGFAETREGAFKKYLTRGQKTYVEREFLDVKKSIGIINKSGGMAFLAHPFLYKLTESEIESAVKEMVYYGLGGIEVYHSSHSRYQVDILSKMAKKYNLLFSGGSDFHGLNKPDVELGSGRGNVLVTYDVLQNIKSALGNVL